MLIFQAFGFVDTPTVVGLLLVFQYVMALYNQVRCLFTSQ